MVWSKPAAPPRIRLVLSRAECNKEEQHPGARELRRALLMGWVGNEAGPLVHGAARRAGPAASSEMRRCAQVPGQRRRRRRPHRELRGADDDGVAAGGQQADGRRVNVAAAAVVTLTGGNHPPLDGSDRPAAARLLGLRVRRRRHSLLFFARPALSRGPWEQRRRPELGPSAARLPATARCRAAAGAVTARKRARAQQQQQ